MIIKDFKDLNVKAFDVHCIRFSSNFHVTVAYDVYYADGRHKGQNTTVLEEPHEELHGTTWRNAVLSAGHNRTALNK